ncbi:hypothetical protein F4777DRAFT_554638 [Nemania sp. FL0916]|nr:hypothetical protein F4777DRAFT_554638 [Nemania sp. FL0916]
MADAPTDYLAAYCENCRALGHSISHCTSPCGFCGSTQHGTMNCDAKENACLCKKYPRHTRSECTKPCMYCLYKDSNENNAQAAQSHSVGQCTRGCNYCLELGHRTQNCKALQNLESRQCPHCPPETYHWPVVHETCPVENCQSRFKCTDHCLKCG